MMEKTLAKLLPIGLLLLGLVMPVQAEPFTLATYPRVDGATVAVPLGQAMAEALIGKETVKGREIGGVTAFRTTHTAYVNLITGKADVVFAFAPSNEEIDLATAHNVQLVFTPIGRDAFVFLAHRDNPVSGLTLQQVRDIFTGTIRNWREVGGLDWEIDVFKRNRNSGSQTYMEETVMRDLPLTAAARGISGMSDVLDMVGSSPKSISYSFYTYTTGMYVVPTLKLLALEGQECSPENIRSERYPFTVTLYAVTRADNPANERVGKLLVWLAGEEGQAAIAKSGFVPLR